MAALLEVPRATATRGLNIASGRPADEDPTIARFSASRRAAGNEGLETGEGTVNRRGIDSYLGEARNLWILRSIHSEQVELRLDKGTAQWPSRNEGAL